jgi:hypothetical protein
MAGSKPVGSFALLKKEVKRIFDKGLLISSYNISGRRKERGEAPVGGAAAASERSEGAPS